MSRHEVDIVAVQQDALTVQSLSTRSLGDLDLGDRTVAALAVWVTDIDEDIDDSAPFSIGRDTGVIATPEPPKGRRAVLVVGSTVFALVVSGGAAAAVTGDPLLVVKAPFRAIAEVNPFDDDASNARDRLPDQAPAVADANTLLADAQRAMARGDLEAAERLLAEGEALLGDTVNPGQQNRIDKVADKIAGKPDRGPKGDEGNGPQGMGSKSDQDRGPQDRGPQDRGPQDKGPQDKGPQDKGPQDKSPKGEQAVDKGPQDKSPVDKDPQGAKPTAKPERPAGDDTSTKPNGGSSTDSQRTEDPSSAKPEKPSQAAGND